MNRGIDHIGMTVPSIEEATTFLKDAFHAEICYDVQRPEDEPMEGEEAEQQLDLPDGQQIIHMRLLQIKSGPSIELFQVARVNETEPTGISSYGLHHFAIYVDDMQEAAQRFERAGGQLLSKPHTLAGVEDNGNNQGVYGKAPWGSLIELIAYPDGIDYPASSEQERWTPAEHK